MRINEVLAGKASQDVVTVRPDATVRELVGLLAEHNIGALVVSADGTQRRRHRLRARRGAPAARDDEAVLDAAVSGDHDRRRAAPATGDETVNDLMQLMTERRFRHVPVVEDGRLIGIVSIGDVVKHRMSELEFERDQLDSYVHSSQT